MAKAHKAPMDTYTRNNVITSHAIERFRERFASWLTKEGILADSAVGNLIDRLVTEADASRIEELVDNTSGEPVLTRLVDISDPDRFGKGMGAIAVTRRDASGPSHNTRFAVVTVLTTEMVDANKRSGAYVSADLKKLNPSGQKPFAALKDMKVTPKPEPKTEMREVRAAKQDVTAMPVASPLYIPATPRPSVPEHSTLVAFIKQKAGEAFARDDDTTATRYRNLARILEDFLKENPQ